MCVDPRHGWESGGSASVKAMRPQCVKTHQGESPPYREVIEECQLVPWLARREMVVAVRSPQPPGTSGSGCASAARSGKTRLPVPLPVS